MAVIVDASDWQVGSPIYYVLGMGNKTFTVYNAGSGYEYDVNASYALTSTDNNTLRFEVRAGDNNWYDGEGGVERSEIGMMDRVDYGTPIHISYDFTLEQGAPNTAKWMVVGQIHQVAPEGAAKPIPPVAINMVGEKMLIRVSYIDDKKNLVEKIIYTDSKDIERGHSYSIDIKAIIDNDGQGRLVVVRDGKVIADYSGPIGYDYEGQVYWKEGVYRSPAKETTAVTFANLHISYGDMVEIPAPGSTYLPLQGAPSLVLAQGAASATGATVVLQGVAKAGQEVRLYVDETFVGKATADANGQYLVKLGVGAGSHILTATTVGADGKLSQVSNDVAIEVGTASDVLARFDYVAALSDLSGVYLTDTNVLTVSSVAQIQSLLQTSKDALEQIKGGYSFQFNSGTSNNRTVTNYNSEGVAVDAMTKTYTDGVLVRETRFFYDKDASVAKEVMQYGFTGKSYTSTYQAYDANGLNVNTTRYHGDGSLEYRALTAATGAQTIQTFSQTGQMLTKTVVHAATDGTGLSRESYTYNVSGQSYVSVYQSFDTAGKQVELTRTRADGTLDSKTFLNAIGESISETYQFNGQVQARSIVKLDGSTMTSTYNALGQTVSQNSVFADKSSEILSFSNGILTTKIAVHAPGDAIVKEVFTYNVTGQTYTSTHQVYGAGNVLVLTERYHANGSLDYVYKATSSGTVTQKYDANGVILSDVTVVLNQQTDTKTYVSGVLTKEVIALTSPTADGTSKITYDYNITGQKYVTKVSYYNAGGKLLKTDYLNDPTPHVDTPAVVVDVPTLALAEKQTADLAPTNDLPTLSGTSSVTGKVLAYDYGVLLSTKTIDGDKAFSFDLGTLTAGHHALTVKVVDAVGNTSASSGEVVLDVLRGGTGSDSLTATGGRSWMFGGDGDDTYVVGSKTDIVVEKVREGTDTVVSSISFALPTYVENLKLVGSGNLAAVGNALANEITGNVGNNTIDGGIGADMMIGLSGNDTYIVDNILDAVKESPGEGADTILSSVSYALSANVETLILNGSTAISGAGNDLANVIVGNDLANILDGRGNADKMIGELGDDSYTVDNIGDTVVEMASEGNDTVNSSISYTLADNVENLVLTGNGALSATGNVLANSLRGNTGDNVMDGGAGADRMEGRAGNDTYIVDDRNDKVIEYADQGTDTIKASVSYNLGGAIENLVLTGSASISGNGNDLNNILTGNDGQNTLNGGAGDDIIDGGLHFDTLFGGAGSDKFVFSTELGRGNVDTIGDMTSGTDVIQLSSSIFKGLDLGMLDDAMFKDVATGAVDANDHILYDSSNGHLYYDADGSGAGAAVELATINNNALLNAYDFFIV